MEEVCEGYLLGVFGAGDEGTSDGESGSVGEFAEDVWFAVLERAGDAEEECPLLVDNASCMSVTC